MVRDAPARSAEIAGIVLLVAALFSPESRPQSSLDGDTSAHPPARAGGGSPASSGDGKESTDWAEVMRPPAPRTLHAMAFDSARGESILVGGRGDSFVTDTWEWNGARWELRATSGPSPRASHALVFDDQHRKTFLFGGRNDSGPLGDSWEWSGTAWTNILTTGPSPRFGAATAFDTSRARAVLFGGQSAQAPFDETWEWDGSAWTTQCASASCKAAAPSARSFAAAAFDADRRRFVLFGGKSADGTRLADTWEWDGTRWFAACAAGCTASPSARSGHALAYDANAHVTVLFGGETANVGSLQDTWLWDGTTWKRTCGAPCSFVTPASQSGHAMAYDAKRGRVVLVTGDLRGQTWEWDGATWSERKLEAPPPRDGHGMTFDASRGRVVLFGGGTCDRAACTVLGDTWEWNGAEWLSTCVDAACKASTPAPRLAHAVAYDRTRKRTVLFGGTSGTLDQPLNDLWEWDGARWARLCTTPACAQGAPPPRFAHAMAYDAGRKVIVLFGGQGKGVRFGDTWEWDGAAWTAKCLDTPCIDATPSARSRHTMAYDAKRARTVLFGGIDGPVEGDTWEWDGTQWKQSHPPTSPPPRAYGALAYDSRRTVIALFGGAGGAASLFDVWEWDGSVWREELDSASPPGRTAHALVYDEVARHLFAFGGFGESVLLGDTWEHRSVGGACNDGAECEGGHCVDGVCCESECGVCERCNGVRPGECVPVLSAEDVSCSGLNACDASGRCRRKDGQACRAGGECVSGFCVDDVCCATACTGPCKACRAELKNAQPDGICGDVADGKDPHDSCGDDGACSCQRDGFCNGSGGCRLYALGTSCAACSSGGVFRDACDGLGACVSTSQVHCDRDHTLVFQDGTLKDCAPYRCSSTGACLETCKSEDECAAPNTCHANGTCAMAPVGPSRPELPPVFACRIGRAPRAFDGPWALGVLALAMVRFLRRRCLRMAPRGGT